MAKSKLQPIPDQCTTRAMKEIVKQNNAAFKAMNVRQRTVALAKDMLAMMRTIPVKVEAGGYIYWDMPLGKSDDVAQLIPTINNDCSVCAKGAAFLSHVRLFDACPISDISHGTDMEESIRVRLVKKAKVFEEITYDLLEACFERTIQLDAFDEYRNFDSDEGYATPAPSKDARLQFIVDEIDEHGFYWEDDDIEGGQYWKSKKVYEAIRDAVWLGVHFSDDRERLVAALLLLIKNKGVFKVPKEITEAFEKQVVEEAAYVPPQPEPSA